MSCTSISYPHQLVGALAVGEESLEGAAASTQTLHHCQSQSRTEARSLSIAMATCYAPYEIQSAAPVPHLPQRTVQVPAATTVSVHKEYAPVPQTVPVTKDYSRPLHVDCSVEYELPNAAKPPQGVRNEPLLMIHPCYFRKIESQRRSPFVNNLPPRQSQQASQSATAAAIAAKRRLVRAQQMPQPQQAAPYPVQYTAAAPAPDTRQMWEQMPPLVPITAAPAQPYCKVATCGGGDWTTPDLDRSPDRPEDKHILSGKYRQYLRGHRLHPYVSSAIPLASTFPQLPQQVCYNV